MCATPQPNVSKSSTFWGEGRADLIWFFLNIFFRKNHLEVALLSLNLSYLEYVDSFGEDRISKQYTTEIFLSQSNWSPSKLIVGSNTEYRRKKSPLFPALWLLLSTTTYSPENQAALLPEFFFSFWTAEKNPPPLTVECPVPGPGLLSDHYFSEKEMRSIVAISGTDFSHKKTPKRNGSQCGHGWAAKRCK